MGKPSVRVQEFMATYKVDHDEVWEVRTGGDWAIKHRALERVAAEQGITFDLPTIIEHDGATKNVSMIVTGRKGDRVEWSIGEASPSNYRTTEKMSAYPYAMAEKRGKDRVVLKLLNSHGALYSQSEIEEEEENGKRNRHTTTPADVGPEVEYDEHGDPIDNIPKGDDRIERMSKAKARSDFAVAQHELRQNKTERELKVWGERNANRIESYPIDWQEMIRGIYADHRNDIRNGNIAA